jgi:ABC-2 type transport system permease protein
LSAPGFGVRPSGEARIFDRGYRPYTGPRLGRSGAIRSLVRSTAQRVMGIRRPARAKVLPFAAVVIAFVPAMVFIGVAALVTDARERRNIIPTYGQYYGFIVSALIIFAAFVAPEALCPDRRTGLLGLYLASPLTRTSYLLSKIGAVLGLLAVVTLGPPLLMVVAFVLQGVGPDGPLSLLVVLAQIVAAGFVVAGVYSAVSLGVSSLTDRKGFAAGAVLLILLVTGAITGALVNGVGAPQWVLAFNLARGPFELVQRIYGEHGELRDTSTALLWAVAVGWMVLGFGVTWWRYRRLVVVR